MPSNMGVFPKIAPHKVVALPLLFNYHDCCATGSLTITLGMGGWDQRKKKSGPGVYNSDEENRNE